MLCGFSIIITILLLICFFIFLIFPIKLTFRQSSFFWWIFILALSIFAYYAEPSTTDDLYRHYENIVSIKNGEYNTSLVIWKWILTSILIFGKKGLLPAMTILVIGESVYGIMKECKQYVENRKRTFVVFVIFIFGFCSIFAMISGIRNASVAAIWSCAYFKYYNNKKKKKFYTIVIIISLIHLSPLFPTFFLFISEIFKKLNRYFQVLLIALIIGWPFILQNIISVISNMNISYIGLIVLKINNYYDFGNPLFYQSPWYIIPKINCLLVFILILLLRNENKKKKYSFEMVFVFGILTASCFYSIFLERMLMFVGFLTLPIIGDSYKMKHKLLVFIMLSTSAIMCLFYFNALIAHMDFYGIDLYRLLGRRG